MNSVVTRTDGAVFTVTIDRFEARNAVNLEVAHGVAAAVDEFEARDDLSVAILTGAGGTFCAGMDVKAFGRGDRPSLPGRGFAGLTRKLPTKPLIAAVEGWALAGGLEPVLAAHLLVASREAKLDRPEVKRGLVAVGGGLLRLPKVLPYQLAMRAALAGDPITAAEAHGHGLVATLSEPGQALSDALVLAGRISASTPLALRATKRIVGLSVDYATESGFADQAEIAAPDFASGACGHSRRSVRRCGQPPDVALRAGVRISTERRGR